MNTEINDSYDGGDFESYDEGIDATDDVGVQNAEATQDEKMDAIASLLSGDSSKADAMAESGVKPSNKPFGSRAVDGDGRPTYGSENAVQQGAQASQSPYGFNANTPGSQELLQQREQAEQVYQQAFKAKEEVERQLSEGLITDQQAQEALHIAGMYAGQAQHQILTNEIAQRDMQSYQRDAYQHIAREFDINPNDTEAVNKALGEAVTFLRSCHISDADLATVDDPAIAITAIKAHRAIERDSEQRDQIAQLKAQVRRLKQARGEGRRSGRKAMQAGVKGDKTDAMLDEVVALLGGGR